MNKDNRFALYRQLLKRIDETFSDIYERNEAHFQCGRGCYGCCKSGLTVTNVEAEHIRKWLRENPNVHEVIKTTALAKPLGEEYCVMLDKDGACSIYDARPVICRSHGTPTLFPDDESDGGLVGDVCPLNFQDKDLATLGQKDWIRVDTLNTALVSVDIEFDRENSGARVSIESILLES